MPTISEFFGIVIRMYYEEHGVPHFHAYYSGDEASLAIESLEVLDGSYPDGRWRSSWSGRSSTVLSCATTGPWRTRTGR
ncbi:MAG: DUF4160 domain-containing protein [Thermoanaerobaculaceae bacterium]